MKRVLITGASGFIGSYLADYLKNHFSDEYELVLLSSKSIPGYLNINTQNHAFTPTSFEVLKGKRIDVLIHLGAFSPKKPNDVDDYQKNCSSIESTVQLLNSIPNVPELVILGSSISVYGNFSGNENNLPRSVDESTKPSPANAYGLAKYCTELVVRDWCKRNNCKYHILRFAPIYGEGDKRSQFVYTMMKQVIEGNDIDIYAPAGMVRNLLHVEDCCRFIEKSMQSQIDFDIVNLVSSTGLPIEEIGRKIANFGENTKCNVRTCATNGQTMNFDFSMREKIFGVEVIGFDEGMRRVYKYIESRNKNNLD